MVCFSCSHPQSSHECLLANVCGDAIPQTTHRKKPNLHMNFFSVQLRGSCLIIYSSQQPFSVRIKLKIYFQKRMVLL